MLKIVSPILTLMVDNEFGVLTRVTSQIRREGWNIKSLAVAETTDPTISRITLCLECFEVTVPGVIHKLQRLQCVKSVTNYNPDDYICRELAVVRFIPHPEGDYQSINQTGCIRLLSTHENGQILEITGSPEELSSCINALQTQGKVEAARTGAITLEIYGLNKEVTA